MLYVVLLGVSVVGSIAWVAVFASDSVHSRSMLHAVSLSLW